MSKIVRFHHLGAASEVLELEDSPLQQPGPREVRLQVKACGLNRAEALFVRGQYLEQPVLPARVGYEAAGIVDAVGEGVEESWLGKRAASIPGFFMNEHGVLGEQAVVPARVLAAIPDNVSYTEAAATWMQYLTAYGALVYLGRITKGDFVIISAASSSVGLAAIQIVKAEGGISIATTRSSAKKAELLSLGADHIVTTGDEDIVARVMEITSGKGARLSFDAVGGSFVEQLAAASASEGIIFEYGALAAQPTPFPTSTALHKQLTLRGYTLGLLHQHPDELKNAKEYVDGHLKDGQFVPKIARTFPLSQIREAYRYLESNAQVGKVVVEV